METGLNNSRFRVYSVHAARILLGLIFFLFGIDKFIKFIPIPTMSAEAGMFFGALAATGYFLPFLAVIEISAGFLLLSNRAVPLAVAMLAAVIPHIFLYLTQLAKNPQAYVMAFTLVTLDVWLFWNFRSRFKSLIN